MKLSTKYTSFEATSFIAAYSKKLLSFDPNESKREIDADIFYSRASRLTRDINFRILSNVLERITRDRQRVRRRHSVHGRSDRTEIKSEAEDRTLLAHCVSRSFVE